jgi:hypothetical protein
VPRFLPLLLAVALAAAAIWLHLPGTTPPVTVFTRGSLAVLPEAEQALKAGNRDEALRHLRAAYARAIFEGRPGIAERVRARTGLAGMGLLDQATPPDPATAWPFLEAFALWSDDFNRDAGGIENAVLSRPALRKTRFEYRLTRPDGSTFWAGQPLLEWTGLWPFWKTWLETTTKPLASGLYLEKGASWPVASYALVVPLNLRNKTPLGIQGEIAASGVAGGAQCLFTPPSPFGKAEPDAPGRWHIKGLLAKRGATLTRVILFTDTLPGPRCLTVTLVRDYQPLR